MVVEHKLGSVAWQEDAEPGFAAASVFPLLSGVKLLAQEYFGKVLAKCWDLVHGSGTFISSLGLSVPWTSLLVPCSLSRHQPSAGLWSLGTPTRQSGCGVESAKPLGF